MTRLVSLVLIAVVKFALLTSNFSAIAAERKPIPRVIPPPGIELSAEQKRELQSSVDQLAAKLNE
ncbi:MAG TPA: hypothetical protein VHB99_14145, partial [Pirellulales bacterium]|nr:hypothetical protein [Pirellulales bacterium]